MGNVFKDTQYNLTFDFSQPTVESKSVVTTRKSLVDGMRALQKTPAKPSDAVSDFLLSDVKKSSKKKNKADKKKKKKKNSDSIIDDGLFISSLRYETTEVDENGDETYTSVEGDDFLDAVSLYNDDIAQDIIEENLGSHKERKKSENTYRREFGDELTLLSTMLNESKALSKEVHKQWKSLTNSKVRGSSKYANELGNLLLSTHTQQLQIVKEISGVKKTIADLSLKDLARQDRTKASNEGADNNEMLASQFIQSVLKTGRGDVISRLSGQQSNLQSDDSDLLDFVENNRNNYNDTEYDDFNDIINRRIASETSRGHEENMYIQHEADDVQLKVKRCLDMEDEWEIIAVDRDNIQIPHFPVPNKAAWGRVQWADDNSYVRDQFGRSYDVIPYYSRES